MAHAEPTRVSASVSVSPPTTSLDVVDIRDELDVRPRRPASLAEEHRAFTVLASEMASNPRNMLQKLVELAVDLCDAHTAGISLLDGDVFRWEAVAGVFAGARGGTMPREQSPCGVCIDRNATQLMHLADRCFPALSAEPRFVEALLVPFHASGKPIGTVWIVSHTDDKKFDKEDERLVRELAQFASAGWQLLQTSEALAESNRRKDNFLATLGHELRNPLGAIVAATSVLQQRSTTDRGAVRALDVIARQSQHMSRLADDLLDIARIESGKLQLERRTLDLRAVVAATIDARRSQIEHRRQSLTVELGEQPIMVDADPIRFAQVVSNLIDNAAKYTPENGHIAVSMLREGDEVEVIVSDDGVGIPPERAASIFDAFTQLETSRAASSGGLGIGLALVKSLTELHGGAVTVASDGPNRGSSFYIRLPVHTGPSITGTVGPFASAIVGSQ
jgi:signal transduction histidine kinase